MPLLSAICLRHKQSLNFWCKHFQDTCYEYYVDTKKRTWASFEDKLPKGWRYNAKYVNDINCCTHICVHVWMFCPLTLYQFSYYRWSNPSVYLSLPFLAEVHSIRLWFLQWTQFDTTTWWRLWSWDSTQCCWLDQWALVKLQWPKVSCMD